MGKRIALFLGHPDSDSFCGSLARIYVRAAEKNGAEVRYTELGALKFDPVLHRGYKVAQELEHDLQAARRDILWAGHLVFVYPLWWGAMPALLKGFVDRVFTPGFGFQFESERSYIWRRLLHGRSARLIVTMDGPPLLIRLLYQNPGIHMMRDMTLEFCGVSPVGVTLLGSVKRATRARRLLWKMDVEDLGRAGR